MWPRRIERWPGWSRTPALTHFFFGLPDQFHGVPSWIHAGRSGQCRPKRACFNIALVRTERAVPVTGAAVTSAVTTICLLPPQDYPNVAAAKFGCIVTEVDTGSDLRDRVNLRLDDAKLSWDVRTKADIPKPFPDRLQFGIAHRRYGCGNRSIWLLVPILGGSNGSA